MIRLSTHFGRNYTPSLLVCLVVLLSTPISMQTFASTQTSSKNAKTVVSTTQLANELKQYLTPVNTLKAHFSQTTTDAKGRKLQTTKGIMQIKRPELFRWQINDPFPQLLVSNGKKVWIYDQELQQVTIRPMDQQTNTVPAAILSGDIAHLAKNYTVKASGPTNSRTFVLAPKQKDSLFETLTLTFTRHHLSKMILSDSLGTKTTIHFSEVIENKFISDKQFVFTPPKNADVLDETRS